MSKSAIGSFSFTRLTLHSSEELSHDVKKLRFAFPDPDTRSGLPLTSAVVSVSFPPGNGRWTPVFRPYTPTSDPDEPGFIEFMIKLYPNGKQSTLMHSLKPGDSLYFFKVPSVVWKPNQYRRVVLIAGGAGITPMYQLLKGILSNPEDQTQVTLVWGVNSDADLFLKDEFAHLKAHHPAQFQSHYVVSHPVEGSQHEKGYVTKEVLQRVGLAGVGTSGMRVLLCGPPAMENALTAKGGPLIQLGFSTAQIEKF
ncbi:FAD-binding FR-type domain-containing protein [Mycena indigotica]|uniref:NADH-cytochrome b5 reductase n=1 Tax=Mycena indigotica TaxID=2126181 RepID=A0A8H6SNP4_9AGAR|nr:FAD-binding FR-type domain-containing protein [Mycena indigotica]KAF7302205.1 FAD-binding FR-type domain-containing protein [Mycena indigotica]